MRRLLAVLLLGLLPLQFSWAAVAPYCGHETQAGTGHLGHHEHLHQAGAGAQAESVVDAGASMVADGDKVLGAVDSDCGYCHGHCSVMPTLPSGPPTALSTPLPSPTLDDSGGAHAATRPERPKWLPLA